MDRPKISRGKLIEILVKDQPWSPILLQPNARQEHPELWQYLMMEDIAKVQADRLLNPLRTGHLLDRLTVRTKLVEVGLPSGAFQLPEIPITVTTSLATRMADVQLTVSPIDLTQTCAQGWERLSAIQSASEIFGLKPTRFLEEYDGAQEYLLRIGSSPEEFRAHQTQRIDAKQPEIVKPRIEAFHEALRAEVLRQMGRSDLNVEMKIPFPVDDGYWRMRAWWLQCVEIQIQRVWPGQERGTTQVTTDDA